MAGRNARLVALVGVLGSGAIASAGEVAPSSEFDPQPCDEVRGSGKVAATSRPAPAAIGESDSAVATVLDPDAFFESLVQRYKGLNLYRDTARLVQVTTRGGEESSRVETEIGCEMRDSALHVTTPTSQARSSLGLSLPVRKSPIARVAQHEHDLWLAPHMKLKFADEPLHDFRAGVEEGFIATGAESITINDRLMVHVELRSGDGLSDSCNAKFDLFVNPQTMLVERIDGEQRLPDGARFTTTLEIKPQQAEGGEPAA